MKPPIIDEIMALKDSPLEALKTRYNELFPNEPSPASNKVFLWRRIAYRLQEIEYGGLSANAQAKLESLIETYDPINNKGLRPKTPHLEPGSRRLQGRDRRLPIPGAIIRKEYKGRPLEVKVLDKGFEYQGQVYKTLSAVAKAVTGIHWNGYLFFKP